MNDNGVMMFWFGFWLYLASFLLFVTYWALHARKIGWVAAGTMFAGFIPHTIGIIQRWISSGHLPMSNMYEYSNLMSWMAVAVFGVFLSQYRRLILGAIISPALIIIIVVASILPKEASDQLVPALRSYWLAIHVSLAALAEGAFAVSFSVSVVYLLTQSRSLQQKGKGILSHFPQPETLDEINFKAIAIGYPLFTIGALFAGSIWALEAWGTFWSWDPKEVGALVVWLFYTVYLHARLIKGWQGHRAAWLSIIGFAIILLSFFGNLFLGGNHAYN